MGSSVSSQCSLKVFHVLTSFALYPQYIDASEAFVAFVRDLLTHDPSLRPEVEFVASEV